MTPSQPKNPTQPLVDEIDRAAQERRQTEAPRVGQELDPSLLKHIGGGDGGSTPRPGWA